MPTPHQACLGRWWVHGRECFSGVFEANCSSSDVNSMYSIYITWTVIFVISLWKCLCVVKSAPRSSLEYRLAKSESASWKLSYRLFNAIRHEILVRRRYNSKYRRSLIWKSRIFFWPCPGVSSRSIFSNAIWVWTKILLLHCFWNSTQKSNLLTSCHSLIS